MINKIGKQPSLKLKSEICIYPLMPSFEPQMKGCRKCPWLQACAAMIQWGAIKLSRGTPWPFQGPWRLSRNVSKYIRFHSNRLHHVSKCVKVNTIVFKYDADFDFGIKFATVGFL